ncbi:hypothetical protein AUJ84_00400 [Candidatus Pacearchaeota archaeon CG1_02_32_132]|nr:MAG: hypothetical protein AUJ84_00400 [Candidatus Pacearchaeota archaeon CG1_02_32_132]
MPIGFDRTDDRREYDGIALLPMRSEPFPKIGTVIGFADQTGIAVGIYAGTSLNGAVVLKSHIIDRAGKTEIRDTTRALFSASC